MYKKRNEIKSGQIRDFETTSIINSVKNKKKYIDQLIRIRKVELYLYRHVSDSFSITIQKFLTLPNQPQNLLVLHQTPTKTIKPGIRQMPNRFFHQNRFIFQRA